MDTAASGIGHDGAEVHIGVEAKEGEGESVLASGFAVAWSGVATSGGEDWLDIEFEFEGLLRFDDDVWICSPSRVGKKGCQQS